MIGFAAYSVFTAAEMDNRPTFWEFLDELTAEAIPKMKEEKVCCLFCLPMWTFGLLSGTHAIDRYGTFTCHRYVYPYPNSGPRE